MRVDAFVDTGAAVSVISSVLAEKLALQVEPWDGPTVVSADGKPLQPKGKVRLTVRNKNSTATGDVVVIKTFGPEFILGRNLLRSFQKLTISFSDTPTN